MKRTPVTPAQLAVMRRLPGFPESAEELILVAGLDAAAALITAWPGQEYRTPHRVGGVTPDGRRQYARLEEIVGGPAAACLVSHYAGTTL